MKASTTPLESSAALARLLDAQHYTAGWGFARQGTPTHNTSDASSPYPPPDPGGAHSFRIERGSSLGRPGGNGVINNHRLRHSDRHADACGDAVSDAGAGDCQTDAEAHPGSNANECLGPGC